MQETTTKRQPQKPRLITTTLKLTPRERSILPLLVRGLTNAVIAKELGVGTETVKSYIDRLRMKLGAGTKTDIAVKALQLKLVTL